MPWLAIAGAIYCRSCACICTCINTFCYRQIMFRTSRTPRGCCNCSNPTGTPASLTALRLPVRCLVSGAPTSSSGAAGCGISKVKVRCTKCAMQNNVSAHTCVSMHTASATYCSSPLFCPLLALLQRSGPARPEPRPASSRHQFLFNKATTAPSAVIVVAPERYLEAQRVHAGHPRSYMPLGCARRGWDDGTMTGKRKHGGGAKKKTRKKTAFFLK